jgi:prepilin-type N-terminal cleavage/methylation domain-containing protein
MFSGDLQSNAGSRGRAVGFTIVELIVVIVILAVAAGLVAPRLMNLGGRQARADAQAVAEVLAIAARREDQTSQPVAVEFDAERNELRMMVFAPSEGTGGVPQWRTDRLAPAAVLRSTLIERAVSEGNELTGVRWRIELSQSSRRPAISVTLRDETHGDRWRVQLPAGSTQVIVTPASANDAMGAMGGVDGSIDLDRAGRGQDAW